MPVFTVLPGGARHFELPKERVDAGSELRLQAESNAGPIDAAVPAHARQSALLVVGLAIATVAGAAPPEVNVAALTAAVEHDLAVVTVSVNGIRKEGLAYVLRDGDTLLIDSETLQRLSIRFDSSTARERDGRLMVSLATITGLAWTLRPETTAP